MSDHRHLIIDLPHLQSLQQRIGAFVVALTCWLLWIYFLIPLLSLSGWLMGMRKLSQEIRWFGGYKSLLGLMQLYGETVLLILAAWVLWSMWRAWRRRPPRDLPAPVDNAQLCQAYAVNANELAICQRSACITVQFDAQGQITGLVSTKPLDDSVKE